MIKQSSTKTGKSNFEVTPSSAKARIKEKDIIEEMINEPEPVGSKNNAQPKLRVLKHAKKNSADVSDKIRP